MTLFNSYVSHYRYLNPMSETIPEMFTMVFFPALWAQQLAKVWAFCLLWLLPRYTKVTGRSWLSRTVWKEPHRLKDGPGWWLEHEWIMFPDIGNFIIPTDELIFFRGLGTPPTSSSWKKKSSLTCSVAARVSGWPCASSSIPRSFYVSGIYQLQPQSHAPEPLCSSGFSKCLNRWGFVSYHLNKYLWEIKSPQ